MITILQQLTKLCEIREFDLDKEFAEIDKRLSRGAKLSEDIPFEDVLK